MKIKELIITGLFILVSLTIYNFFPAAGIFQQVVTTAVFFLVLPLLFNKIVLKRNLNFYGISIGDWKTGLIWSIVSLTSIGFIFFILSRYFGFLNEYGIPTFIVKNFANFLFYEFIAVAFFVGTYEFYFRGFLMNIFKEKIKYWSILLQTMVFVILVISGGTENMTAFAPYLIVAPFAGIIAYKTKSILFSGAVQFIVLFVLNLVVIKMVS